MLILKSPFGETHDGLKVESYALTNAQNMRAEILTYGGILRCLEVPDCQERMADVTLGYDTLADYIRRNPYFGAIVGRYANRIAGGTFTLDGVHYKVNINRGSLHLHGGHRGFDKVIWEAEPFQDLNSVGLKLSYVSQDGEEGYPGKLFVTVTYTLTNSNELMIHYSARTDRSTILNLTNHSYFNLGTGSERDILGHELMLNADGFTVIDSNGIPTGEIRKVDGTPLDFRKPMPIGARINQKDDQLQSGRGYDHNWVLNTKGGIDTIAARLRDPITGRCMEVFTTQPGIQFYTGNNLDETLIGKADKPIAYRSGLCLETQHFPNSPNQPSFPSTVLRPGDMYNQLTIYRFSAY
jgi:aldose 1-epimerase